MLISLYEYRLREPHSIAQAKHYVIKQKILAGYSVLYSYFILNTFLGL